MSPTQLDDGRRPSRRPLWRKRTLPEEEIFSGKDPSSGSQTDQQTTLRDQATNADNDDMSNSDRAAEAAKQLFCGGIAGSVAKTVTAPFSRLTILFQVHSLVTTKEHRPKFAMSLRSGLQKIVERGGLRSMWKGNMTSVLHRFPYSAINFYIYENTLDALQGDSLVDSSKNNAKPPQSARREEPNETSRQLVRRVTRMVLSEDDESDDDTSSPFSKQPVQGPQERLSGNNNGNDTPAIHKFMAGATAGTTACLACYPLDLVRTRLTTELEGREHYKGIVDAFRKIHAQEGLAGFYSGVGPTLLVAVPNFAISYTVYGTLKEYTLDDELFYNLRRIDSDSGEAKLGFGLTVACGAASGTLATLVTFPMDTIRRRMQIQNLHIPDVSQRLSSRQQFYNLVHKEGLTSLYRGLTPELLKVIPMVGTMFLVYEWTKDMLNVGQR